MMSLATIVGALFAYPINAWMVKRGLKHGMMSRGMEMHHHGEKLPLRKSGLIILTTYLLFFGVLFLTSLFAPIRFY